MTIFGFALSLFAIVQGFSGTDRIYWLVNTHDISAAIYGPYANHNHYACLMEMLVPLALSVSLLADGAKRILLLFAATLMAGSIVLSRSRGGMIGIAFGSLFFGVLVFRKVGSLRKFRVVLPVVALIAIVGLCLITDQSVNRLSETHDPYRLFIGWNCLHMWKEKPLLGFGWGTFPTVYPAYRSFHVELLVNHAHNDYLELLVETGLAGVAIGIWFFFVVFREAKKKILVLRDNEGMILTIGLVAGIISVLFHSFFDFSLHIPANAALFFVLCAATATSFRRHRGHGRDLTATSHSQAASSENSLYERSHD
jgi:O-antigen ligase